MLNYCWLLDDPFTVPLVAVFTKFYAQIIQEFGESNDKKTGNWYRARKNAESTFQQIYHSKVFNTKHAPKAYVLLEGREWTIPDLDKVMVVNRYGHAREELLWLDCEDCWSHW